MAVDIGVTEFRGKPWFSGLMLATGVIAISPGAFAQSGDFFEKQVRPILVNNCYACHGPNSGEGQAGLRLDSLAGMLEGGRS